MQQVAEPPKFLPPESETNHVNWSAGPECGVGICKAGRLTIIYYGTPVNRASSYNYAGKVGRSREIDGGEGGTVAIVSQM
jgi:hypothetical protein